MEKLIHKKKGIYYFILALCAFSGLGIEALYVFLLEPAIYGIQSADWDTAQNISHWIITCITWGLITYILVRIAKKRFQFNITERKSKIKIWQWICMLILVVISFGVSYWDWNGFKILKEYRYNGLLQFIFQYIYYVFETLLFTLIIVYGQKAFDVWFGKVNIPFGGILLAVTWGLVHILTKGSLSAGLLSALGGIMYGIVYLLANRDLKKAVPVIFIMFIL